MHPIRTIAGALVVSAFASATSAQTVADVARRHQCATAGIAPLSNQLADAQLCATPGAFVPFAPHAHITLNESDIHAFLGAAARTALWNASDSLTLGVNSAFRTIADQYVLYHSGACALAATPGNSNHETGRAVDLQNWSAATGAMERAGCTHTYPSTDPVHFDCPGPDMRAESIRAFQRLWNLNHPDDMLDVDGAYGPATESRLASTPAGGFANGGSCAALMPDWAAAFVSQSFPLASADPIEMHVGESIDGYIELRNTGTHAWDTNTRLATTGPRDRVSALAGPEWPTSARYAEATGAVAMGATHRFAFTLHGNREGLFDEHLGVVEDHVAWFSDPGQGGPADGELEIRVRVLPALDGGVAEDSGTFTDAARRTDGDASDDAGYGLDGGPQMEGGCGCTVPGAPGRGVPTAMAMVLAGAVLASRRRRSR